MFFFSLSSIIFDNVASAFSISPREIDVSLKLSLAIFRNTSSKLDKFIEISVIPNSADFSSKFRKSSVILSPSAVGIFIIVLPGDMVFAVSIFS